MNAIKSPSPKPTRRSQVGIPASLLFFGVVACVACAWFGLQVAGPLKDASRLHSENDAIERQLRNREIQNQNALKQVRAIDTDQGAIAAARAKGYMFANERPLHIQNETPAQ